MRVSSTGHCSRHPLAVFPFGRQRSYALSPPREADECGCRTYNSATVPFALKAAFHPNYFFLCPKCAKRIEVIIDFEKVGEKRDAQIFLKCLPPGGCGWSGELSMSKGAPTLA